MGALRIHDFMRQYGIGRSKVYLMIGDGVLKAKKIGRATVIDGQSVANWYAGLPDAEITTRSRKVAP